MAQCSDVGYRVFPSSGKNTTKVKDLPIYYPMHTYLLLLCFITALFLQGKAVSQTSKGYQEQGRHSAVKRRL